MVLPQGRTTPRRFPGSHGRGTICRDFLDGSVGLLHRVTWPLPPSHSKCPRSAGVPLTWCERWVK
ncbi:hypothetical protein APS60_09265 [Cutibacterium acnes]|uniref:Uncharacterized protein n=1 Tax=Cutibacterium acnes TaxID=1747 RepID=A0AA44U3I8_CUTAC|nr:MAG: hypothetical protein B6I33_07530 [Propionibacterium sp. 4572_24]PEN28359.1 hypothetical protein APS59_09825 [Cutibacterium acnes]PGF26109.1 hypothetical protein B1B02_09040 [Cutibacterium acnes subsp. defendens]PGF26420.1 hypothetical protein B1B08_09025 [Cutibacterium acnes subsp. defendens]PGF38979.1 hypothetical protein B1B14_10210 [Cutibacterium acnes subsp. defendens]